jgi:hypothetical protein
MASGAPAVAASATTASATTASGTTAAVAPALAFRSGETAGSVAELVTLLDRHPGEAQDRLYSGEVARWLEQVGRDDLAQRAQEICRSYPQHREQGLEALAQATGLVEPPLLQAHPASLDFGTIAAGERKTLQLELRNAGRGHLFGLMRASHRNLQGPRSFDGNHIALPITFNTKRLASGSHSGELVIDSSAGELRLPFFARVKAPPLLAPFLTVVFWSILGMIGGLQLRTAPFADTSPAHWDWLGANSQLPWNPIAPLFGLVLWAILVVFVTGEATRQKSCMFFMSFGAFSALLAFLCGLIGNDLIVATDLLLQPLLEPLVHRWAAGGWMFTGGFLGAVYGTLRRWPDLFSARLLQIVFGWLLAICILFGVLIAALIATPMYK